ncbi:MAG: aromatic ring-hydroxylating dioxygenase subunit alpha [Anaerolineae bacterium]|nr:aromatic ring-hydroxylating dioxygenase subunit alpha [Anaerolineae bacterium]
MINDHVLINDWHVVARSQDVAEGQLVATRLLEEDLVLWRLNGRILAWQDLCIHRGTRLSLGKVEGEAVVCPYHGWTYNAEGRCIRIPAHPDQVPPAKARLKPYKVRERYELVWVSLGEPDKDIPPFPEWDDPTYHKMLCGPYGPLHASAPRAIENFLDMAHLPFVHAGILGDPQRGEIPDYEVEVGPDGIIAKDISIYQPGPYGSDQGGSIVIYTFRAFRPLCAYFIKEFHAGYRLSIFFPVTPHQEMESTAWMYFAVNYETTAEEVKNYNDPIIYADIPIVESQRPELLPLDLQAELHLRSDRTAIAYRKWLNKLGMTFGTA